MSKRSRRQAGNCLEWAGWMIIVMAFAWAISKALGF